MLQKTEFTTTFSEASAVTIGKFDGVHKGHRKLLEEVLTAKASGLLACGVSIFPPPGSERTLIYTAKEQRRIMKELGLDVLMQVALDDEMKELSPEQFVKEVLCDALHAKRVVTGEDFRFGKERRGDVPLLQKLSVEYGFELICVPKVEEQGERVSSTEIRKLLEKGAVGEAGEFLGQPYFVQGNVVHGKQLGRTLGIPTINVLPSPEKLLPLYGVYATRTKAGNSWYRSITNIGLRPTVKDEKRVSVETYLEGFEGDLYDECVVTEFLKFLRPEQKFDSIHKLKEAMNNDIKECFANSKEL